MNTDIEQAIEDVVQQWRKEPITVYDAARLAARIAYEDAAQVCDRSVSGGEFARAIRERAK